MPKHLQRALEQLMKHLMGLSARVEQDLVSALRSLQERDAELAESVIRDDEEVDQMEIAIEEECLQILALHQPVAIDLRTLVSALKINNDLERIGDLAADIAQTALRLMDQNIPLQYDFSTMGHEVKEMLRRCLNALVNLDSNEARWVLAADERLDEMNGQNHRRALQLIRDDPDMAQRIMHQLNISRRLERIGDQITNIAEDVIYLIEGEIVRHQRLL